MRNWFGLLLGLPLFLWANFPWPLAPMNEQHRISATFDECREDRDHFHSGTDLPLAEGGAVLSIEAGQVTGFDPVGINAWIRVGRYAYVHVTPNPALNVGDYVAQGAVVGWTNDQNHIHLNDGGGSSGYAYANSLREGGITPFSDPYHPRSPVITFRMDGTDTRFTGTDLSGHVDIWAQAADTTDLESSIDMNNGVYKIGWALYSPDTATVLEGPYYRFQSDALYSSNYINNLYAPGSSTSTYIHIVTNSIYSNSFLNCDAYDPGNYVIAVISADTRNNRDTTYVAVRFTDEDLMAPDAPVFQFAGLNDADEMMIKWQPSAAPDLAGYKLYYSFNGTSWTNNLGPETLTAGMSSYSFASFPQNSFVQLKLTAVDSAPIPNESEFSDVYGVKASLTGPRVLIVDGFDRLDGSWSTPSQDFSTIYGLAVQSAMDDVCIEAASNEWIQATGDLAGNDAVIWFLGDNSRTLGTFSTAEQTILKTYLTGGGCVFLSGSEIGYDLSVGDTNDQDFLNNWLGISYAGDAAGNYNLSGVEPFFTGFSASYGTTPYTEDWPDYFNPSGAGEVFLNYGNGLHAGIANAMSLEPGSGKVMTVGFAWETMNSATARAEFMTNLFNYFETPVGIIEGQTTGLPTEFSLSEAYPNPSNATVIFNILVPRNERLETRIFDITGRLVWEESRDLSAGSHQIKWGTLNQNSQPVTSGIYLAQFSTPNQTWLRKMTIIK